MSQKTPGQAAYGEFKTNEGLYLAWEELNPRGQMDWDRVAQAALEANAEIVYGDSRKRLQAFLYILIRDEVPFGTLWKIMQDLKANKDFNFTDPNGAALAKDLAEHILETT